MDTRGCEVNERDEITRIQRRLELHSELLVLNVQIQFDGYTYVSYYLSEKPCIWQNGVASVVATIRLGWEHSKSSDPKMYGNNRKRATCKGNNSHIHNYVAIAVCLCITKSP